MVFPLSFIILSLVSLVPVPTLGQQRTNSLWRGIADEAEPARIALAERQLALAREMSAARGYAITGDDSFVHRYREALARDIRHFSSFVR